MKHLPVLKDVIYADSLERLGLDIPEWQRLRQDSVFTYPVIFDLVGDSGNDIL